ncbi:MAG: hypothetical protein M3Y40_03890 [Chloroflexota bacterium]|nr:hypothetical protein [Chloroflexota bacterium]
MTERMPVVGPRGTDAQRQGKGTGRRPMIETIATGLGNGIGWMAESGILFAVFAIAWIAFGAALVASQGSLDGAWQFIRGLPLLLQGLVWLLFLPVMVGLWIWEGAWPIVVKLILIAGVAGWNLMVLLPRALQLPRP